VPISPSKTDSGRVIIHQFVPNLFGEWVKAIRYVANRFADRHQAGGAGAVVAPPAAAGCVRDATRCAAAAHQPLRIAAGAQPGPLGAARADRRGQISHLDRGQPVATGSLRRPRRGQAGRRDAPAAAATRVLMPKFNSTDRQRAQLPPH
jgi:hypothetical protein